MPVVIRFVCLIAIVLVACNSSQATLITVAITAADGTHQEQVVAPPLEHPTNPNGSWEWKGSVNQGGSYTMQWDLLLDPDPTISGAIALTNTATTTQTFTLNVSQGIVSAPAGSPILGASAISISDANGSGAGTVSAPTGSAIYTAFINSNITQKVLFVDPYSKSAAGIGGAAVDSQSFSTGTTSALATIMGIQHSFTLTAGDSATMNSTFTITVPEPCGVVLAAFGAIGLAAVHFGRRTE